MMQDSRARGLIKSDYVTENGMVHAHIEFYAPYHYLITDFKKCEGPGRSHKHARAQQRT